MRRQYVKMRVVENRFQRGSFERLRDAYAKARYSKHYKIAEDQLAWLGERAEALMALMADSFCSLNKLSTLKLLKLLAFFFGHKIVCACVI